MRNLGDRIRDAITDKLGNEDELKAVTMQRAAGLLGMSKSGLYQKLNAEKIDVELLEKIHRIIGIDIEALKTEAETGTLSTSNSKLKEYTFRVKSGEAKVYLPNGSDKEDVKTLIQYLSLFEKSF